MAVRGLEVGDSVTVTIPSTEAYGDRSPEAVHEFPRDAFPPEPDPEVGWIVELESEDGQKMPATIIEVADGHVTLDFSHPLAGEDLTFEIELVSMPQDTPAK